MCGTRSGYDGCWGIRIFCAAALQVNSIIREGKRQRFCQQCGRFHDLTCFDADKRSCRARLQRHNARRRKKVYSSSSDFAQSGLTTCGAGLLHGRRRDIACSADWTAIC